MVIPGFAGRSLSTLSLRRFSASAMTTATIQHPRFAPLNSAANQHVTPELPKLAGVVFDVDGTLTQPQTWMFLRMRAAIGIAESIDILTHISSLAVDEQSNAMQKIKDIEKEAMLKMLPQRGLVELMEYLEEKGIRKGILTRNNSEPVNYLLDNFLNGKIFSPIVTREFQPPKPNPAGILHIAENWGLEDGGQRLVMVGDSIDDITAGRKAGAVTVLLVNDVNSALADHEHTDCVIKGLDELIEIFEEGFALESIKRRS